jgi:hypothetical protein
MSHASLLGKELVIKMVSPPTPPLLSDEQIRESNTIVTLAWALLTCPHRERVHAMAKLAAEEQIPKITSCAPPPPSDTN